MRYGFRDIQLKGDNNYSKAHAERILADIQDTKSETELAQFYRNLSKRYQSALIKTLESKKDLYKLMETWYGRKLRRLG